MNPDQIFQVATQFSENEPQETFLSNKVVAGGSSMTIAPDQRDVDGLNAVMERYEQGLAIEKAAVDALK